MLCEKLGFGERAMREESDAARFFAALFPLLFDERDDLGLRNGEKRHFAAAGDNSGEHGIDGACQKDEEGVWRGFFECFEQGVAACREHLMHVVDDEDFDGSLERRKSNFINELADIFDGVGRAFSFRAKDVQIGMVVRGKLGCMRGTHEKFSEADGKQAFSDAVWAVKEQRARDVGFFGHPG